jgi:hypothetical protein
VHDLFPYLIASFPIKYLGPLLSLDKLPKSTLLPLADQMTDKLPSWKGKLMHQSGRLALIKSTLAAIPIYTAMSHELPAWLLKAFKKIFKAFLWTGTEVANGGKCLVAWCRVQLLLQLDGQGVPDLKLMGHALRLCWLWLHRNDPAKPWATLPLPEDSTSTSFFNASICCIVGDGHCTLF